MLRFSDIVAKIFQIVSNFSGISANIYYRSWWNEIIVKFSSVIIVVENDEFQLRVFVEEGLERFDCWLMTNYVD